MIPFIEAAKQKEAIASSVMYALPEWFGLPEQRRKGNGRSLFLACEDDAKQNGYRFWQVKQRMKTIGI